MKKINKFWKIYIFSVTVFLLVGAIALSVIYVALGSYENGAEELREAEESVQAAESLAAAESEAAALAAEQAAELAKRDELERESLQRLLNLKAVGCALSAIGALRSELTEASRNASPEKAVGAFVSRLNAGETAALASICQNTVSKYEKPGALTTYLSSLGKFTFKMTSSLTSELYASGTLAATLTLSEAKLSDFGFMCYEVSSAVCVLPELSYTVSAPHGAELSVNANVAAADRTYTDKRFDDVPAKYGVPQTDEYLLSHFIFTPEFSSVLTAGNEKAVLPMRADGGKIEFLPLENESYKAALTERAILLAIKYGDFVAGDIEFSDLKPFLLRGTPLYSTLAGYNNDWYFGHSSMDNINSNLVDFIVYSESLVYARVQYRQVLYNGGGGVLRRVDIDFEIYMVCTGQPDIPDITDAETTVPDETSVADTAREYATDDTGAETEIPPEELPYADWVIAALYSK